MDFRNDGLTNSARSPVSGCTRTMGCSLTSVRLRISSWYSGVSSTPAGGREAMHAAQAIDECPHDRRQRVIGRDQVGELGVAAVGRHDLAAQDRRSRRIDRRGDVGVPAGPRRGTGSGPGSGLPCGAWPRNRSADIRRRCRRRHGPRSCRRSGAPARCACDDRATDRGRRPPSSAAGPRGSRSRAPAGADARDRRREISAPI